VRQRHGRRGETFVQKRNQRVLLVPALQLPDPEAANAVTMTSVKTAKPAPARRRSTPLISARGRSAGRRGLVMYCSAINSDFIERSGNSVVAMISGSHSARAARTAADT